MKRIMSLILTLVLIFNMAAPVSAASTFNATEIYGYEGKVYLTQKKAVLRTEPHNKGTVIDTLPEGYPITADGLYKTNKGTMWIKLSDEFASDYDYREVWIYAGNTKEHKHEYVNLQYYKFKYCKTCGHIRATSLDSYNVNLDDIHIALAAFSLIPAVGNGFDIIDGLISLSEGNTFDAMLSFASAVPVLGGIGNAVKTGKKIDIAVESADLFVALEYVDGYTDMVRVQPKANYYKLKRQLNRMYVLTGDDRFYKLIGENIPKRSVAAHHIVAIGEKASEEARTILMYLGIDLNGASNGVYLCMKSEVCSGTIHKSRHSDSYYEYVNKHIREAFESTSSYSAQRVAVIEELDNIAHLLQEGKLEL